MPRFRAWILPALVAVTVTACTSGGGSDGSTGSSGSTSAPASSTPARPGPVTSGPSATTGPATSGPSEPASPGTYRSAPCPNPIYPGVPQLDLGDGFDCGYLTVPENRQHPTGRTVRIAVATARSAAPNPGAPPLVYLAGGPGGSGLLAAAARVAAGWNTDRDVIFLDQRGTWKSDPLLACPEIDAFLADWIGRSSLDPATADASAAATRACRDRIVAQGWEPASFATADNAADVADLRTALGIDRWDLYGVSYGTDLALQTLRDHPAGIRSVVLDSVVPPQDNVVEGFWPSAAQGLRRLFDECAADSACAAAHPTLEADFTALVNDLAGAPRTVESADPTGRPVQVVIDGYKLANLVVVASLVPGQIEGLPALIDNLARGDGSLAAQRLAAGAPPAGVTGYGLALGVFCGEHAAFTDRQKVLAAGRAALPDFPDAVLSLPPQAPYLLTDCAQWDMPAADPAAAAPVTSDVPALLMSGALDAVTSPANALQVTPGLPAATNIVLPGAAHDVMIWQPECGMSVMRSFLLDPGAVNQECVAGLTGPTFSP